MSKAYAEKFGKKKATRKQMREFVAHHAKVDEQGNPVIVTEQHHKEYCDVNNIINKYKRTGLYENVARLEMQYGDVTGADYQTMVNTIAGVSEHFEQLPDKIKKRFDYDPSKLLHFMDSEDNRDEAIQLGLIDARTTPESDGLGEHSQKPVLQEGPEAGPESTPTE